MKRIVLFYMLLIYSCISHSDQRVVSIDQPLLVEILALSEVTDLNQLQTNIEKNLWVKIYRLPGSQNNDCFPESHGVCKYRYYLASSQLDDSPVLKAYFIGELGEITHYEWLPADRIDTAIINITANKYTREALAYNRALKNTQSHYKLIVTSNAVKLVKEK